MKDDWSNEDSNPLKDIKEIQESQVNGGPINPLSSVNFSTIEVEVRADHVDERGEPRKDVLIYEDRLLCHADMEYRLKQGLALFFGNKKYANLEEPPQ